LKYKTKGLEERNCMDLVQAKGIINMHENNIVRI
jgi:hypothetical protein